MKVIRKFFNTYQEAIEYIAPKVKDDIEAYFNRKEDFSFLEPILEIWEFSSNICGAVIGKNSTLTLEDRKEEYYYFDYPIHPSKTTVWDEHQIRYYARWYQEGFDKCAMKESIMEALELNGILNTWAFGYPENDVYVDDPIDKKKYYKIAAITKMNPSPIEGIPEIYGSEPITPRINHKWYWICEGFVNLYMDEKVFHDLIPDEEFYHYKFDDTIRGIIGAKNLNLGFDREKFIQDLNFLLL
jgi:hypothetical protein